MGGRQVTVLGSLNVDFALKADTHFVPGETVLARNFAKGPGGKGLNQAVAASLAGAETSLVGAIGDDAEGGFLLSALSGLGVASAGIVTLPGQTTGLACVLIDDKGQNAIVVHGGANRSLTLEHLDLNLIRGGVLLAQLEIDPRLVGTCFRELEDSGTVRILNAAPAVDGALDILGDCDFLILNEVELATLAGTTPRDRDQVAIAARSLLTGSLQSIIVTLGKEGAVRVDRLTIDELPAVPVDVVDTTGAGDCFCGVFAASMALGMDVPRAIRRSIRASAVMVTRMGAASAIPRAMEYDENCGVPW
jgi:ribokinase